MASTSSNAAFNVASAGLVANSAHKSVQPEFERLPGNEAPTVQLIGYGEAVTIDEQMRIQKIVDRDIPAKITLTGAYTSGGASLAVSTYDSTIVQVNQVLLIDDELFLVTAVPGAGVITVAGAQFGTTAANHANGSSVYLLPPMFKDTDTFVEAAKSRGEFKTFYPMQVMYQWSGTAQRTAIRSYLTKGQGELQFEHANKMKEAIRQLEGAVWYAKAQAPTGSAIGSFDGISRLITTNADATSGVLTGKRLNDLAELVLAWDNSLTDFDVFGNRNMKRIWDAVLNAYFDRQGEPNTTKFGTRVDSFNTSLGTFNYTVIPNLRDGELYFLQKEDVKLHPLELSDGFSSGWNEFTREPQHTNALTRAMSYWWIGTLLMGDERKHAKMTNITTTASSYAGYV